MSPCHKRICTKIWKTRGFHYKALGQIKEYDATTGGQMAYTCQLLSMIYQLPFPLLNLSRFLLKPPTVFASTTCLLHLFHCPLSYFLKCVTECEILLVS